VICALCGQPIEHTADAYRRVVGWERPGRGSSGVSGSSLVLREALDEFACGACITRLRAGLNVAQETLV
jgi:hypothetical protein